MRTSVSWKGTLRASCRDLWVCSPAGNKIPPKDSIWSSRGESHRCPVRVRSSLSLIATWPRPLETVCENALPSVCSWDSGCAGTFCHSFSVDEDKEILPRVYIFIKELTEIGALLWFKCCSNIIYSRKEKQKVLSHCDWIPAMLFYLFLVIFDVKTCWEHRDQDRSCDRAAFTMQDNYHKMCLSFTSVFTPDWYFDLYYSWLFYRRYLPQGGSSTLLCVIAASSSPWQWPCKR